MVDQEANEPTPGDDELTPLTPREPTPAPTTASQSTEQPEPSVVPGAPKIVPVAQQVGRFVMIAAAVLFGVFAVSNTQFVDFSWVFGNTEVVVIGGDRASGGMPLIILLGGAFALGLLVGYFGAYRGAKARVQAKVYKQANKAPKAPKGK